jgi:hypothetical protein
MKIRFWRRDTTPAAPSHDKVVKLLGKLERDAKRQAKSVGGSANAGYNTPSQP